MSESKNEVLRAAVMITVIAFEWYAMQPYHDPLIARFWEYLARMCRMAAERFGRAAIAAENNYYIALEAGI
jgi:hypothetical protein